MLVVCYQTYDPKTEVQQAIDAGNVEANIVKERRRSNHGKGVSHIEVCSSDNLGSLVEERSETSKVGAFSDKGGLSESDHFTSFSRELTRLFIVELGLEEASPKYLLL